MSNPSANQGRDVAATRPSANTGPTLLVLECYLRNALAVIERLDPSLRLVAGARGCRGFDLRRRLLLPRRVREVFAYTDPVEDADRFKQELIDAIRRMHVDAVIPTGTTVTDAVAAAKREVEAATSARLLVEDHEKQVRLADKWQAHELCRLLDVPVPPALMVRSRADVGAALEQGTMSFPCLIKPLRAFASQGVRFFHDAGAWEAWQRAEPSAQDPSPASPFMLQEFIAGELHDVTSCAWDGEPLSLLSQRRIVTARDFGGGGLMNITTHEPQLLAYAERILRHLRWNGILELDFIRDARGRFYLLECNPKVWGTTDLTIQAGMNVAQQLVDSQLLGIEVEPIRAYEVGLLYRWLFPECVFYWLSAPRSPGRILSRIRRTLSSHGARRSITRVRWRELLWFAYRAWVRVVG